MLIETPGVGCNARLNAVFEAASYRQESFSTSDNLTHIAEDVHEPEGITAAVGHMYGRISAAYPTHLDAAVAVRIRVAGYSQV